MSGENDSEFSMDVKNSDENTESGPKMAAVVLVDATDMKEYVIQLNEEDAKRAATDVSYALALLNTEKAKLSKTNTEDGSTLETANADSMITSPTQDDSLFRWGYVETEYLIREYRRLQPLFNSGRVSHKKCWNIIADTLNKEGVAVTATQCISKYRTLKRTYRAIKQHASETGQARMWRYYKDVEAILANDPSEKASVGTEKKTESLLKSSSDWRMDTDSSVEAVEILEQELGLTDDGDEPHRWSHEAIMLLIEEAIQVRPLCESGILTQRKCWDRVATELSRKGPTVTGRQCLTKFNCLRRTYKNITEYNARIERGEEPGRSKRLDWKYYDIVGRLLEESWTYTVKNGKNRGEESRATSEDEVMVVDPDISSYSNAETFEEEEVLEENALNSDKSPHKQNGIDISLRRDRETNDATSSPTPVRKSAQKDEPLAQNEGPEWCDKATRLLIGEYRERRNRANFKGNNDTRSMWTIISGNLKRKGFSFSPPQVESRWKALEKAFRFFGTGKSSSTIRIAPYYAELRKILRKKSLLINNEAQSTGSRPSFTGKFVLRRGVLVAKPPVGAVPSGTKPSTNRKSLLSIQPPKETSEPILTVNSNRTTALPIISSNQSTAPEDISRERDTDHRRPTERRRKQALLALRDLKDEIAKQTLEIERHAKQRESYCQKIIEQNEIMIKQRDRRNDLLEQLLTMRKQE